MVSQSCQASGVGGNRQQVGTGSCFVQMKDPRTVLTSHGPAEMLLFGHDSCAVWGCQDLPSAP